MLKYKQSPIYVGNKNDEINLFLVLIFCCCVLLFCFFYRLKRPNLFVSGEPRRIRQELAPARNALRHQLPHAGPRRPVLRQRGSINPPQQLFTLRSLHR